MKLYFAFTTVALLFSTASSSADYFPPAGQWQQKPAAELKVNTVLLQQAVDYAIKAENNADPDQAIVQATTFGAKEPYDQIIGPMKTRAPANGIIIYKGAVIAQWGDTEAVDMTHSITKTFLTTVTGLAWQQGLIHNLQDKVEQLHAPWR